ncbi:hypothetical protein PDG61_05550 [Mycolicibacterium sp. BiH015]|uniref:hypothetical protein n=1 Tax=Mycolicibacterium sp. BiH015 TaxID=3018808 RepID=UPI0022E08127|nr:hypothetical protein [Mycolicibacterium sp. BiH015]MDA2890365.1 hypothetical protein [Mycolicibacterium sp. BiH015]
MSPRWFRLGDVPVAAVSGLILDIFALVSVLFGVRFVSTPLVRRRACFFARGPGIRAR